MKPICVLLADDSVQIRRVVRSPREPGIAMAGCARGQLSKPFAAEPLKSKILPLVEGQ